MNKFSVGCNMPGYMPDNEPEHIETLKEAKEMLLTDITHYLEDMNLDSAFSQDVVKESVKTMELVNLATPQVCNVWIGNLVFWIVEN